MKLIKIIMILTILPYKSLPIHKTKQITFLWYFQILQLKQTKTTTL